LLLLSLLLLLPSSSRRPLRCWCRRRLRPMLSALSLSPPPAAADMALYNTPCRSYGESA
jgi:hypothetical protein